MLRLMNRYRTELGDRGDAGRARGHGARDRAAARDATPRRRDRAGRVVDGGRCRRRRRDEPDRPQVPDRLSVAPRVAARDGAGSRRARAVRVGARDSDGLDRRQRQRRGRPARSSRTTRRSPRRTRCRSTSRSWARPRERRRRACCRRRSISRTTGCCRADSTRRTAPAEIAVFGAAAADADFTGDGDRVRYRMPVNAAGPVTVDVELRYQPIGFRWAEPRRLRRAGATRSGATTTASPGVLLHGRADLPHPRSVRGRPQAGARA